MGSIESNKAVCGPVVSPNKEVNQNSNGGQPRVGELFFIHQEVDNVSLSTMSSDPTAYTETGIEENLTDYPLSVKYALSITAAAASTHSSVSSVSHDIVPKKFKNRSILAAFRRKAHPHRTENTLGGEKGVFPGDIPKTLFTDPAVNRSTDPTIDIENQPSQEEESINGIAADEESIPSKAQSSISSFSEGFGGYIYQNCSELNSRTTKLLISTAAVLFLFGVSAVVAAFIVDGNPSNTGADNKQLTSFYDPPTVEIPPNSIETSQTTFESPTIASTPTIAVDNATLLYANATAAPTTAHSNDTEAATSNDEFLDLNLADTITTSEATASATVALSEKSITTSEATATANHSATSSSSSVSTPAATTSTTTTSASTISSPSTLTVTYVQAIANSLLSLTLTDDKGNEKGKNDDTNSVNVETVVRFDISPMTNDPRGLPFKVLMRLKNKGFGKVSSDYLPKAGLWDCSPCERAQISSTNSVGVGTFDDSGYLDTALAFSRGIFNNQMTFKLSSGKMPPAPELVLIWVEGDVNDFAGLTAASLMEKVSEGEVN